MNPIAGGGLGASLLLGAPLFIVIFALALLLYPHGETPIPAVNVFSCLSDLISKDLLIPIPLFTIAGFILAASKAPQRILRLSRAIFGWLPGGVAIVAILTMAFFTTFTGASGVTIIALGGLLYPILTQQRYPEHFRLGVLTSSGSIGLLFFPSLPVFIYVTIAVMNDAVLEVDALFMAGLLPGMLMVGSLMLYSFFTGVRVKTERTVFSISEVFLALKEGLGEALLPAVILGLFMSGEIVFADVAIVTFAYIFVLEVVIHRDLKLGRDFLRIVVDAMSLVGAIVVIIVAVSALNNYLIDARIPQELVAQIQKFIPADEPILFLLALNVFLLIVGCMMDIFSAMIAILPLILPLAAGYDIHPLHLGIIFLANLEVGYLTPPVGMNLFISALHFKKPIMTVSRSVLPFMGLLLITLAVITYYEPLSRWLPQQFGKIEHTTREADQAAKLFDPMFKLGAKLAGSKEEKKATEKLENALKNESVDDYTDPKKVTKDEYCDDKTSCSKGKSCVDGLCLSDDMDDL